MEALAFCVLGYVAGQLTALGILWLGSRSRRHERRDGGA